MEKLPRFLFWAGALGTSLDTSYGLVIMVFGIGLEIFYGKSKGS